MDRRTLVLIAEHYGKEVDLSNIDKNEIDNNSWWYLDCKLESEVGYDKAVAINCKSLGLSKKTIRWKKIRGNKCTDYVEGDHYEMYFNGIIDVKIRGINKPCVGFFWVTGETECFLKDTKETFQHWQQRGLVVFADDAVSYIHAYEAYKERTTVL